MSKQYVKCEERLAKIDDPPEICYINDKTGEVMTQGIPVFYAMDKKKVEKEMFFGP